MLIRTTFLSLALILSVSAAADEHEAEALAVMQAFLQAFNARDEAAWAATLHFPHVRLASQQVSVYPDREAFIAAMDMQAFERTSGWQRSTWDDLRVVQSSPNKVHIAVTFSRYRGDGPEPYATFDSLYIIELVGGRWGVRARSSFAP